MRRVDVLLTGGNDRSMLATARSLSARGISYAAIGLSPSSAMGVSRYLRPHLAGVGPDARSEPEAFVDFLLDVVRERRIRLVFPLTNRTLLTCDTFREAIEAEARLAAPPSVAIRNVLDKKTNLRTARELGIPCPTQFELEDMEQVPQLIEKVGFPLVLKNPGVPVEGESPRLDLDWVVVRDEGELDRHLTEYARRGVFPIVQEYLPELAQRFYCFAVRGEIVAAHQCRLIRSFRGRSVFRETIPVSPMLHRYTALLMGALHWEGMAGLEFKVRARDGDVRYIETNARPWSTFESAIAFGWDFPVWMYEYFLHGEKPVAPPPDHAVGTRARWLFGDLAALADYLAGGEQSSWTDRSRAGAILDYLSGFSPRVHPDVFRWDDPLPELAEHARGAKAAARHVLRKSHASRRLVRSAQRLRKGSTGE